jgi:hypothetical protein
MKSLTYTSPLKYDFTKLTNYRSPENTLGHHNKTWIDARSSFFKLGEYHIFVEACERRSPEEIEIERTYPAITDEQESALSSVALALVIPSMPATAKEIEIVNKMGIEIFFCTSSIVGRNTAFIYQNHLCFL